MSDDKTLGTRPDDPDIVARFPRCADCHHLRGSHYPADGCHVVLVDAGIQTPCGCTEFRMPC
jgi:hypothetical protein